MAREVAELKRQHREDLAKLEAKLEKKDEDLARREAEHREDMAKKDTQIEKLMSLIG